MNIFLILSTCFFFCNLFFKNKKLKYSFILILFLLSFIPLYQAYNFNALLYAFFDSPSFFCVLLCLFSVGKILAKDLNLNFINFKLKTQFLSFVLIFTFSGFLYLSSLNFIPFDLYHSTYLNQALFIFIFLLFLFFINPLYALLALSSLFSFILGFQGLFESIFDIYLFVFSFFALSFYWIKILKEKYAK